MRGFYWCVDHVAGGAVARAEPCLKRRVAAEIAAPHPIDVRVKECNCGDPVKNEEAVWWYVL